MANEMTNIRIILINTSHAGNIGATARAMKTMGLSQLYLVKPYADFPSAEATARAAGADSVLAKTIVVDSLEEAIADCGVVIGSSSEERSLPLARLDARSCGELIVRHQDETAIAMIFGTERSGMSNDELALCQHQVVIPTSTAYSSLNLAQAVQIICYEIHMAALAAGVSTVPKSKVYDRLATATEMAGFYQHLQQALIDIDFLRPGIEKKLLPRLHRLYNRAQLEKNEINMLRGILTAAQTQVK